MSKEYQETIRRSFSLTNKPLAHLRATAHALRHLLRMSPSPSRSCRWGRPIGCRIRHDMRNDVARPRRRWAGNDMLCISRCFHQFGARIQRAAKHMLLVGLWRGVVLQVVPKNPLSVYGVQPSTGYEKGQMDARAGCVFSTVIPKFGTTRVSLPRMGFGGICHLADVTLQRSVIAYHQRQIDLDFINNGQHSRVVVPGGRVFDI